MNHSAQQYCLLSYTSAFHHALRRREKQHPSNANLLLT